MSNMSYCRWENTAADMADCTDNQADLQERWDDENDAPSQYEDARVDLERKGGDILNLAA